MFDRLGRKIYYLRVSVTDRCNLRCRYCMPEEGVKLIGHDEILSLEEIARVVEVAVSMGVSKVRITGGEPLIRGGIVDLVRMIGSIDGVEDFGLTTNGILLGDFAKDLAGAGLKRVNVSIDTIIPERYAEITRGGDVGKVIRGIDGALSAGLLPVKINCVVSEFTNDEDIASVRQFGRDRGVEVRTIRVMDFKSGSFSVVEGASGGDCANCSRLRLTSNGFVRPCLFSDLAFDVRELGANKAIREAVMHKPDCGQACEHDWMHGIGG